MSALYGVLGVSASEAAFVQDMGQQLIFDAVTQLVAWHNEDLLKVENTLVKGKTTKFQMRHLSPGGGEMTPAGQDPHGPGPAVGRYGSYDVAFPLEFFEESFSKSRRALADMDLEQLDAHLDTIFLRDAEGRRRRMLTALFEDSAFTYVDIINGTLTFPRLANTDGTIYPPVPGAAAGADDQHYRESTYTVANITNAANPMLDLLPELMEHQGGRRTTGVDILYLHGTDQTQYLNVIADFTAVPNEHLIPGADTDLARFIQGVPGRMYGEAHGCWLAEWEWIPDTYGIAIFLPKPPLLNRVHASLPNELTLVATEAAHPLEGAYYTSNYGYAVYDRLSAAVIEVSGDAPAEAYAPPAAYAE
jgi:hypothetical protein